MELKKKKKAQSSFSFMVYYSEVIYFHDHINLQILLQIISYNSVWHPLITLYNKFSESF